MDASVVVSSNPIPLTERLPREQGDPGAPVDPIKVGAIALAMLALIGKAISYVIQGYNHYQSIHKRVTHRPVVSPGQIPTARICSAHGSRQIEFISNGVLLSAPVRDIPLGRWQIFKLSREKNSDHWVPFTFEQNGVRQTKLINRKQLLNNARHSDRSLSHHLNSGSTRHLQSQLTAWTRQSDAATNFSNHLFDRNHACQGRRVLRDRDAQVLTRAITQSAAYATWLGVTGEGVNRLVSAAFSRSAAPRYIESERWRALVSLQGVTVARVNAVGSGHVKQVSEAARIDMAKGEVARVRDVALVSLLPTLTGEARRDGRESLLHEYRMAGRFQHPNVMSAPIEQLPNLTGANGSPNPLFVLEYAGASLANFQGASFPFRQRVQYALEATRGLAALHARGFVHRDVKPANFLLTNGRVQIADLELCRAPVLDRIAGTRLYLPPDSYQGKEGDMWALGLTLCSLIYNKSIGDMLPFLACVHNPARRRNRFTWWSDDSSPLSRIVWRDVFEPNMAGWQALGYDPESVLEEVIPYDSTGDMTLRAHLGSLLSVDSGRRPTARRTVEVLSSVLGAISA